MLPMEALQRRQAEIIDEEGKARAVSGTHEDGRSERLPSERVVMVLARHLDSLRHPA